MLEKSIIISMVTMAFHVMIYWPGMIFSFVADWFDRLKIKDNTDAAAKHNHKIGLIEKPLFSCPICMVFWYSIPIYFGFLGNSVKEWIIVCFCGMGINSVIVWFKASSK